MMTTSSHHGEYDVWVCGDCGVEVPIDMTPTNRLPDAAEE
jgi:hypothetical protein